MPTLDDKIKKFREQAEQARRKGSRVREHVVLEMVAEELEEIDEVDASSDRLFTTAQAGERLGVGARTVADWCTEGRFPNAFKTGKKQKNGEKGGEWRIPASDVAAYPQRQGAGDDSTDQSATFDDFEPVKA